MSENIIEYRYKIGLTYICNNKEIGIEEESIQYIMIDSNYLNRTFPVIYISLNIKSKIYDKMLENIGRDTVVLSINKFVEEDNQTVVKKYIKDQYVYMFNNTNPNENADLEDQASDSDDNSSAYCNVMMGLISMNILNSNRKVFNGIVNGNMTSIVYEFLRDMKNVIIEPFDNDKQLSNFIIPPITSLNKAIRYLNSTYNFYNTSYRFFIDLDGTAYLLSNKGKKLSVPNTNQSVIIKICDDSIDSDYKLPGMVIDNKQKCYTLYVDNTFIDTNPFRDKNYNKIVSVSTDGSMYNESIDTNKNSSGNRTKLYRAFNSNNKNIKEVVNLSDITATPVSLSKAGLDSSVITPEKIYTIQNKKIYKKYDGNYILTSKQEILRKEDAEYFSNATTLVLAKIM